MKERENKRRITEKAHALGANLVRCCPVSRWAEYPMQDAAFWPQNIWPWAENVVVLGIPLFAPMMPVVAWNSDISPTFTNPTTMTVVADEL